MELYIMFFFKRNTKIYVTRELNVTKDYFRKQLNWFMEDKN